MVETPIYDHVGVVVPDIAYLLEITPQKVLTETIDINQIVLLADDGITEDTLQFGTGATFIVTLQWDKLKDLPAAQLFHCWVDISQGFKYSFQWKHPEDGYTYVVKFVTNISRLLYPGVQRSIPQVRLRVKGKVA